MRLYLYGFPRMEMRSQQVLLNKELDANGWQLTARTRDVPWWVEEVWTVESVWRPVGLQAFLTFEVDPMEHSGLQIAGQANRPRRRGPNLWGVNCTRTWPEDATEGDRIVNVGWKHWDKEMPKLIQSLSRFRDEAV
jgi:hypothetical protein